MGRFGRGGGTPRVVGFDFTPPPAATPWTDGAPAPVAAEAAPYEPVPAFEAPVAQAAPDYPPPAYPPPAYPPPAYPAPAAEPYAAPVATLAPPQPAPGWAPQAAYPPAPAWTPPPAPARRLNRQTLRAGASIVLALGLFAGRVALRTMGDDEGAGRPAVTLRAPSTLGDLPRQTSGAPEPAAAGTTVAAYGRGTTPTYLLYAAPAEQPAAQTLREFTQGFQGDGGTVGAPKAMPGGVWCTTVTYGAVRGGVCAWGSAGSDGVVVRQDKADLRTLATVTVEARTKVNG